jgi:hypothetical protein
MFSVQGWVEVKMELKKLRNERKELLDEIDSNDMFQKIEWGASPSAILKQIVEELKKGVLSKL